MDLSFCFCEISISLECAVLPDNGLLTKDFHTNYSALRFSIKQLKPPAVYVDAMQRCGIFQCEIKEVFFPVSLYEIHWSGIFKKYF